MSEDPNGWEVLLTQHRTRVGELLSTANAMKDDESARLVYLERAVERQRQVVEVRNKIVDAYEPCRKCNRKVKSPCHDAEGYHTSGPWDFSCEGFFYPHRFE